MDQLENKLCHKSKKDDCREGQKRKNDLAWKSNEKSNTMYNNEDVIFLTLHLTAPGAMLLIQN